MVLERINWGDTSPYARDDKKEYEMKKGKDIKIEDCFCHYEESSKPPTEGARVPIGQRWDLIPGVFTSLSEVAKVASYGAGKYGEGNWKKGLTGDKSPLNHALKHLAKAAEMEEGSSDRIWQLAKAGWNVLVQIWFEKRIDK